MGITDNIRGEFLRSVSGLLLLVLSSGCGFLGIGGERSRYDEFLRYVTRNSTLESCEGENSLDGLKHSLILEDSLGEIPSGRFRVLLDKTVKGSVDSNNHYFEISSKSPIDLSYGISLWVETVDYKNNEESVPIVFIDGKESLSRDSIDEYVASIPDLIYRVPRTIESVSIKVRVYEIVENGMFMIPEGVNLVSYSGDSNVFR